MTDISDQLYSPHQILIPPNLPSVLKKFAKAAIRTQPRDLLLWSYHYFKAISNGLPPPVKERIEYPLPVTPSGLTPGFLKVILDQIGNVKTVTKDIIEEKWQSVCLDKDKVEMLFKIGNFPQEVDWLKFVAIAAGSIEKNLAGTMSLLCELLTEEPEGGSSMIPLEVFLSLYKYLAALDCGPIDPYATSDLDIPEEEEVIIGHDIKYSSPKTEESGNTWDTLIREMGQQDSLTTLATDDLREVDSKAGLIIWPDIVPDLKRKHEKLSNPSDEFVKSDAGLQEWDEERFKTKVGKKAEISQGDALIEDLEGGSVEKAEEFDKLKEMPESSGKIIDGVSDDLEETESKKAKENLGDVEYETEPKDRGQAEPVNKISSEESMEVQVEEQEEGVEDENNEPDLKFIMQPDSSMIMVPTPLESEESICSDQRSIKNITESEQEPSIGQRLINTASLKDLKVGLKKTKRDTSPPWASGSHFWIHLPGIGPVIPLNIVDEVEVYMRQCAVKQCGMVMPRNLRHFLCPSLDGL